MLDIKAIDEVCEKNNFYCKVDEEMYSDGAGIEISQRTPEGEDWFETFEWKTGDMQVFLDSLKSRIDGWDSEEEAMPWIENRGKNGIPSSIRDLLDDADWKLEQLKALYTDLINYDANNNSTVEKKTEARLTDYLGILEIRDILQQNPATADKEFAILDDMKVEVGVGDDVKIYKAIKNDEGNWELILENKSIKTETLHADQKEVLADGTTRIKLVDGNHYQWYIVKSINDNGTIHYDIDDIEQSPENIDYFDHNVNVNDVEELLLQAMKENKSIKTEATTNGIDSLYINDLIDCILDLDEGSSTTECYGDSDICFSIFRRIDDYKCYNIKAWYDSEDGEVVLADTVVEKKDLKNFIINTINKAIEQGYILDESKKIKTESVSYNELERAGTNLWGEDCEVYDTIIEGIYDCTTAGHGGYLVDTTVFPQLAKYGDENTNVENIVGFEEDYEALKILWIFPMLIRSEEFKDKINLDMVTAYETDDKFAKEYPTMGGDIVVEESKECIKENTLLPVEELPEKCYGVLPSDNSIILIKKGETGYYLTDKWFETQITGDTFDERYNSANELADKLNAELGVTPEQRFSMEIRSMNGNWDNIKLESTEKEDTSFKDMLLNEFGHIVKDDDIGGGYFVDNTEVAISQGITDENGKYIKDAGYCIYTTDDVVFKDPNVEGEISFEIKAPNYLKDKNGNEYGDTLFVDKNCDLKAIVNKILPTIRYTKIADGDVTAHIIECNKIDAKKVESRCLSEGVPDIAYEIADKIADEIIAEGIMNFENILNRIVELSGKDIDTVYEEELNTDVYGILGQNGIICNFSTGDFYTDEYAETHPEILEESKSMKTESEAAYRAVRIVDASEPKVDYGVIMLNKKHSVKDFQKAMWDAYERNRKEIEEYGDDLPKVLADIDPSFDWYEIEEDSDYLTI